jgi:hypothetical protein
MADTRFRQLERTTTTLVRLASNEGDRTSRRCGYARIREGSVGPDNTLPTSGVSPVPGSGTREGKTKYKGMQFLIDVSL